MTCQSLAKPTHQARNEWNLFRYGRGWLCIGGVGDIAAKFIGTSGYDNHGSFCCSTETQSEQIVAFPHYRFITDAFSFDAGWDGRTHHNGALRVNVAESRAGDPDDWVSVIGTRPLYLHCVCQVRWSKRKGGMRLRCRQW
jgi:hypothetical protein